jgi:hypothetical protein
MDATTFETTQLGVVLLQTSADQYLIMGALLLTCIGLFSSKPREAKHPSLKHDRKIVTRIFVNDQSGS